MGRFLRRLLALLLLPLCAAMPYALWRAAFSPSGGVLAAEGLFTGALWIAAGLAAFVAASLFLPAPMRAYVLGHELTHALWALLFGARVSRLRVAKSGGSVSVSKSNVLITLAPYFFPFYTVAVAVAAVAVRLCMGRLPCIGAWLAAAGFTWAFHVAFTVRALAQRQPDMEVYGTFFSLVFVWLANFAGLLAVLAAMAPGGAGLVLSALVESAVSAYRLVGGFLDYFFRLALGFLGFLS